MAQEELPQLLTREEELRVTGSGGTLIPRDPNDERSVVMEIRAGAGGDDTSLFGALLMRMYARYAERHGWQVEYISLNETELGGVKGSGIHAVGCRRFQPHEV